MKIIINDYGCHPFTLQLAKSLAQKKHIVNYMFPTYLQNPIANFKDYRSCENLFINPIQIKGTYNKYNFFLRRKQEIEYGNISWKKIKNIKAKVLICVTVPLDALRILVKEAKNIEIPLIFWVQDIYSEAIKKILLKKFFLLSGIISWYY